MKKAIKEPSKYNPRIRKKLAKVYCRYCKYYSPLRTQFTNIISNKNLLMFGDHSLVYGQASTKIN